MPGSPAVAHSRLRSPALCGYDSAPDALMPSFMPSIAQTAAWPGKKGTDVLVTSLGPSWCDILICTKCSARWAWFDRHAGPLFSCTISWTLHTVILCLQSLTAIFQVLKAATNVVGHMWLVLMSTCACGAIQSRHLATQFGACHSQPANLITSCWRWSSSDCQEHIPGPSS